jgi:predicted nucleic acid-binding protein
MSSPYLDTGFALKLYVQEPNSSVVTAILRGYSPPLFLTDLLEMELVNALNGKVNRRELTESERDQSLLDFRHDVASGFWERPALRTANLRSRVVALSEKLTPALGTRTLDLWHLAAALELGCTDFLSFDKKQRIAAAAEGMTVLP